MTMLTDEDLAEIKRKLNHRLATGDDMFRVILDIAERVRAESQLDRYREIVEAVAKSNPYGSWLPATNTPPGVVCRWCMERAQSPALCQHDEECAWTQARALLATACDVPKESA